jgi:hypothetical protein
MNAGVDKEWLTTDDKINKDAEGNDGTLDSKDAFVIWKLMVNIQVHLVKNVKISNLKPLAEAIERKQVVVQKPQPITSIKTTE